MNVSAENKAIARHALKAFGGTPTVQAYHHDTENLSIDILRCDNRPCQGVTSYSTIGLSDHPMIKDGQEYPTRLEIAGACATAVQLFPNILASAGFNIIRSQWVFSPGMVLPEYIREYYPSTTVPHIYLTAPFLWEDSLKTLDCGLKKASWLLVVPISDGELEYLKEYGDNALEELFEKTQIDIFDINRNSVS
jgi:antitoxin YqcF